MTNQVLPRVGFGSSRATVAADPEPIALTSSDLATMRAWTQAYDL